MYKRILVPIDGSETSTRALVAALQLAREGDGRVRLVHALEALSQLIGYDQFGTFTPDLIGIMREAGNRVLQDGLDIATAAGVEADTVLYDQLDQRLADVVAAAVADWSADLVVVGTHGRRGIGRALMGSGAEQIIRQISVPVLVIRASPTTGGAAPSP